MARTQFGIALGVGLWLAIQPGFAAIVPPLSQPTWKDLNSEQQQILAPLAGEWDTMEGFRRKKWLGIAQRYKTLSPDEQNRIQRRMTSWAKLTPEERKRARDKYLSLQKAPPEKKDAVRQKWEQYKGLPEAEKQKLASEAVRKSTRRPVQSKPASVQGPGSKPDKAAPKNSPTKNLVPPSPVSKQ